MTIVQDQPRPTQRRRPSFRPVPSVPSPDWQALDQQLPADHPARLIDRVLAGLDLQPLLDAYAGRGEAAFHPRPLLAVLLYEAHHRHHSPALWHRHANEPGPVRWLLRDFQPSRSSWYNFRDRLPKAVLDLAHQTVRTAIAEGFTPANRASLDGTLLAANATRHRLLNHDTLKARLDVLAQAVALDQAQDDGDRAAPEAVAPPAGANPAQASPAPASPPDRPAPGLPDTQQATAGAPGWLAPTVQGRQRQWRRYQQASAEMARRQQRNQQKRASKRTPAERIVIGVGDPEAVVGRDKEKVFRPLYNVQLLCDLDSALILTYQVQAQQNDAGLLGGVLRQAKEGLGQAVQEVVADASYAGGADLAQAEKEGATVFAPWQKNDFSDATKAKATTTTKGAKKAKGAKPTKKQAEKHCYGKDAFVWQASAGTYRCPAGQELRLKQTSKQKRSGPEGIVLHLYSGAAATCAACPQRSCCTTGQGPRTISRSEHEDKVEALRARMQTEQAKELYKLRKQTVELGNADIKQHRGLRRLSGRGRRRASVEVGLTVLAHNLVALERLRALPPDGDASGANHDPPSG